MSEKVKAVMEKAKGKKAKVKSLDEEISGTKVLKLPKDVKSVFGESFPNAKLQTVRVHVGGNAKELCKSLKAKAFMQGPNLVIGKAGDAKNSELIAHELAHSVQHSQGKVPKEQKGKVLVSK